MFSDIFKIVFLMCFIAGATVRVIGVKQSGYQRENRKKFTLVEAMLLFLVFLGMQLLPLIYVFSPWFAFADYPFSGWLSHLLGWAGFGVFVAAIWLLWRSHADLGKSFSPGLEILDDHALVTDGVFRYIRHPMYSAHLLWSVAQLLLLQNWVAGPAMLMAQIPLYLYRIPREERMMLEQFGEEYRRYLDRTGRVIPRFDAGENSVEKGSAHSQ